MERRNVIAVVVILFYFKVVPQQIRPLDLCSGGSYFCKKGKVKKIGGKGNKMKRKKEEDQ